LQALIGANLVEPTEAGTAIPWFFTISLYHSSADLTVQVDTHNIVRSPLDTVHEALPRQDARPENLIFVENSRHTGQFQPRPPVVPMTPVVHAAKVRSFF
jgi:hypothetical protein